MRKVLTQLTSAADANRRWSGHLSGGNPYVPGACERLRNLANYRYGASAVSVLPAAFIYHEYRRLGGKCQHR